MFSKQQDTKHVARNRPAPRAGCMDRLAPSSDDPGPASANHHQEVSVMKKLIAGASVMAVSTMLAFASAVQAQTKTITLCWAAWDPANALVELSKDFTAKTGIQMKFEFVPWPNFADRMLNELNSKGKLCDLMIGDSQWIGGAAENGHYVKLNDFFAKEGIKMDDFMPATVLGYSEWPKNTPN